MAEPLSRQFFGMNIRLLSALGYYPPENNPFWYKIKAYVLFSLCGFFIPICGSLYFLLNENVTEDEISEHAFVVAQMSCLILKFLSTISKSDKLRKCVTYFDSLKFQPKNDEQKAKIDEYVWATKRNTTVYLIAAIVSIGFWIVRPYFQNGRALPVVLWLPFETSSLNLIIFLGLYFFVVLGPYYEVIVCAALDPLIGGLACLASGQLDILKNNLEIISDCAKSNDGVALTIKRCIKHHQHILYFMNEFEECFSFGVFAQVFGSTVVICFCCFQLTEIGAVNINSLMMISHLNLFLLQIFMYCYYGTVLQEESDSITNAIYRSQWYTYDVRCRKLLFILLERSKKPMVFTAGKLFDVSVDLFTLILRRSYSLLAVLNSY